MTVTANANYASMIWGAPTLATVLYAGAVDAASIVYASGVVSGVLTVDAADAAGVWFAAYSLHQRDIPVWDFDNSARSDVWFRPLVCCTEATTTTAGTTTTTTTGIPTTTTAGP